MEYSIVIQNRWITIAMNGIAFYNYYGTLRKDAYIYANNEPAMLLNMDGLWAKVKDAPLKQSRKERLRARIEERKQGIVNLLPQVRKDAPDEKASILDFAAQKPTAVLYGNVVWDLAALDKEVFFGSIREAYVETIRFFTEHPEFQLIVKTHPDEENPLLPVTKERLEHIAAEEIGSLPDNVILLKSKVGITAYELFTVSRCTIVYTSTVGIESAMARVPTVLMANCHYRGKGFTHDPTSKQEYFRIVTQLLNRTDRGGETERSVELAAKYLYHFFFEFNYEFGIPTMAYKGRPSPITKTTPEEYLRNKGMAYIVDRALSGKRKRSSDFLEK